MLTLIVLTAICLDVVLAEPRRLHPLVGFGRCADWVESKSRRWQLSPRKQGVAAVLALLLPLFFLALALQIWLHHQPAFWFWLIAGVVVYGCIALRSLHEHAQAVYRPLLIGNMELARLQLSRIVSRDCAALDEQQVASACCESVLENGSDGVLGAIFWFAVLGLPGVLLYRGANTLDAMWGYRNERYREFGWAAARLDDLLNWIPARLVALSYAGMGNFESAWRCWREQAHLLDSPNAGPVMTAGAGALQLHLGGDASYGGRRKLRPQIGCGSSATAEDIPRTLSLLRRAVVLWILVMIVVEFLL